MEIHSCDAIIITCIDYRLQEYINNWVSEKFQLKTFDRVALGGGVKNKEKYPDLEIETYYLHLDGIIEEIQSSGNCLIPG